MRKTFLTLGMSSLFFAQNLEAEVYVGTDIVTASEVMKEKVYKRGDFVLIRITEDSSSTYGRSKSGEKDTTVGVKLAKWIRLQGTQGHTTLKPAALDEPEIDFESDSSYANQAADKFKSSLAEDITAQIKDVRPNGNFYIEGHKEVRENGNIRRVNFSGEVSKADVDSGNAVTSKQIYNMKIEINEEGERRQQTDRNLIQSFILWLWPF